MTATSRNDLATPANIITIVRICLVPVYVIMLLCPWIEWLGIKGIDPTDGRIFAAIAFIIIACTDFIDGYLARSRNEVTTFGKFLDPIADKLVVIVSLCFLLEQGAVSAWVLLIIVAREFLVSGLRMVVASEGTVIAASNLGKWKTATTMVSISGLLLVRALPVGPLYTVLLGISNVLLLIAVVLTAWSGIDYFMKSWRYIADAD